MKSGCIQHPANEPLIIIRKWQLEFTDGDRVAAALLSFFEYWHSIKLEMGRKNTASNNVAEQHGYERDQDEGLWQFHTEEDLENGILIFKRSAIAKAIKNLESTGIIETGRNPNPRYKFDRTKFFLFKPEIADDFLLIYRNVKSNASSVKSNGRSDKSNGRSDKSNGTIPETTTETTTEKGDQADNNQPTQPTTTPPLNFPKADGGEYSLSVPKRTEQLFVDGLMPQVKSVGLDVKTFREMVDYVLAKHGKLDMVQADTEFGRKALSKAQEACLTLAKTDPKFRSVQGIESVYQSWYDNDWRWETLPTMNQLVEHAGMMKAGAVVCQRKDKQQTNSIAPTLGMVMHFAGDQP